MTSKWLNRERDCDPVGCHQVSIHNSSIKNADKEIPQTFLEFCKEFDCKDIQECEFNDARSFISAVAKTEYDVEFSH